MGIRSRDRRRIGERGEMHATYGRGRLYLSGQRKKQRRKSNGGKGWAEAQSGGNRVEGGEGREREGETGKTLEGEKQREWNRL